MRKHIDLASSREKTAPGIDQKCHGQNTYDQHYCESQFTADQPSSDGIVVILMSGPYIKSLRKEGLNDFRCSRKEETGFGI